MENQKVRDLSTAQNPKTTDFVMLITNLTNNVLEKCQISDFRDLLYSNATNIISDESDNILTVGNDNKLYVTSPQFDIIETLNNLYPIGSIYYTTNDICPLEALGVGTWEQESINLPNCVIDEGTETDSLGITTYYRIYQDGYCEQWGNFSPSRANTKQLPKKFKDTEYSVFTNVDTVTGQTIAVATAFDKTVNSFSAYAFINNTISMSTSTIISWKATGYLADDQYQPLEQTDNKFIRIS